MIKTIIILNEKPRIVREYEFINEAQANIFAMQYSKEQNCKVDLYIHQLSVGLDDAGKIVVDVPLPDIDENGTKP